MFGRGKEYLDYTVEPTDEGRELLAQQALERIETIDGVDYLDGYKLPPDDAVLWDMQIRRGSITDLTDEPHIKDYEYQFPATNRTIRESNIRNIASGHLPLYRKLSEVDVSILNTPKEGYLQKARRAAGNLLQRFAA